MPTFSPPYNKKQSRGLSTGTSTGIIEGFGTSSVQPEDSVSDKNWLQYYLKSSATTGTSRGMYLRLYLSSGAGGEALRAYTTVSNAAPADTVNGAHISLSFGTSAGNVTGEGNAVRATFHLGKRAMTGTLSAVKAEIFSDGTASTVTSASAAFISMWNAGNTTGMANVNLKGNFFNVIGITTGGDGSPTMFRSVAPSTLAASLRVKVGSTLYYLPLYSGQS